MGHAWGGGVGGPSGGFIRCLRCVRPRQYGITLREAGGSSVGTSKGDFGDDYHHLSTTTGHAGGTPAVFGMVGPGVAEVVVEQPGTPTTRLGLL